MGIDRFETHFVGNRPPILKVKVLNSMFIKVTCNDAEKSGCPVNTASEFRYEICINDSYGSNFEAKCTKLGSILQLSKLLLKHGILSLKSESIPCSKSTK